MTNAFTKLDTNGDCSLRAANVGQLLTPDQFAAIDRDCCGRVSQSKFTDRFMADFAKGR